MLILGGADPNWIISKPNCRRDELPRVRDHRVAFFRTHTCCDSAPASGQESVMCRELLWKRPGPKISGYAEPEERQW